MLVYLLRIWLSAAIIACPFVCRGGVLLHDADGAIQVSRCCSQNSPANHSDEPAAPDQPDEHSETSCQCICSGAIVEHEVQLDDVFQFARCAQFMAIEQLAADVPSLDFRCLESSPGPAGIMNPGRVLRCLYQSFLC